MSEIEYSKEGRVATFRINRPEKMGILDVKGMQLLTKAFVNFRGDDDLWVGILTGTGEEVFSAGVDIDTYLGLVRSTSDHKWKRPSAIMRGLLQIDKPLIAACNGLTIGGGFELALACDIMIAADNARFGLPETRIRICPGGGGTVRLPSLIPRKLAAEMLFTGKTIDAQEAYRIGLVNKVVPLSRLLIEARDMANSICDSSPIAVRYAKQLMTRGKDLPIEEALRIEDDFQTLIMRTMDFEEGLKAFKEKRKPEWQGK